MRRIRFRSVVLTATMAPGVQLTYAGSANDLHEALWAMGQLESWN